MYPVRERGVAGVFGPGAPDLVSVVCEYECREWGVGVRAAEDWGCYWGFRGKLGGGCLTRGINRCRWSERYREYADPTFWWYHQIMNVAFILLLYPFVVARIGPRRTYVLFISLMLGVWPLYVLIRLLVRSSGGEVNGWAWGAIVLQYVCNSAGLTCYGAFSSLPAFLPSCLPPLRISSLPSPDALQTDISCRILTRNDNRSHPTPPHHRLPAHTPRNSKRPRTNGAVHPARGGACYGHFVVCAVSSS